MSACVLVFLAVALSAGALSACADDDCRCDAAAPDAGSSANDAGRDVIDERIDTYFGMPPFGELNRDEARRILETSSRDDRPFYMVNLIRHRARAEYPDGRDSSWTGAEADAEYGRLVLPLLAGIGAMPVFVGDVEEGLVDRDGAKWDQVAVVRYPSRKKFVDMLSSPELRAAAVHKVAGVERTIVLVTEEEAVSLPDGTGDVDLDRVPFPPTAKDPPVAVAQLLAFNEQAIFADGRATTLTGREALERYEAARAKQALPLGARPALRLSVEGELYGDGRLWEQFRINNFPSRAAFRELTSMESLSEAGVEYRQAALADDYAVLVAPVITRVGYSR